MGVEGAKREPAGVEASGDREGSTTPDVWSMEQEFRAESGFWRDRFLDLLAEMARLTGTAAMLKFQRNRTRRELDTAHAEIQRLLTQLQVTPPGDELGQAEEDRPSYADLVDFVRSEEEALQHMLVLLRGLQVVPESTTRHERLCQNIAARSTLAQELLGVESNHAQTSA